MKKKQAFTLEHLKNSKAADLNKHLFEVEPNEKKTKKEKKDKYRSNKTTVDGIEFHSRKEATRYSQLRLLLKCGEIGLLRMQVPYELNPGGSHSLKYIADFVYIISSTGQEIVEDAKGFRTQEYIKKRRLMKKVHGISIKET
jgi:hypothetical protein